ncbi:hypothetical protein EYF80_009829 [Liparis tanakae]|uniref:Uncharacterized protein n=1 Tax=Liparis tanakae TaxID=230148 RepID=A0A4Z2IRC9_9TELE|nr:hypothetical protein EYF80_009829 [Liparis tanakae]
MIVAAMFIFHPRASRSEDAFLYPRLSCTNNPDNNGGDVLFTSSALRENLAMMRGSEQDGENRCCCLMKAE